MKVSFQRIFKLLLILISILPRNIQNKNLNIEKTTFFKDGRDEIYRPKIHFSPSKNWMNDPNGMVFFNGVYHLYFQYNPKGDKWGNMSWGHATSPDLIHWEEQPVAILPNELGDIFSGSCVIDKENTAGYGKNVLFAIYTSSNPIQQQSIAYSFDNGQTFTNYPENPVIPNDDDNLRDPKVFWHEQNKKWVMVLAKGWAKGVEIYSSKNLKTWEHLSTFLVELPDMEEFQWECPELLEFDYKNEKKWVLLVSVNPRSEVLGSGTMYFVGNFDGTTFTADPLNYPLWLDYGMDNYAGVTFSNFGKRKVLIGWMNNWLYGEDIPCSPWRSAMTLPRELKLIEFEDKPLLANTVVDEIYKIAGTWKRVINEFQPGVAYQLKLQISLNTDSVITLYNEEGQKFVFEINASSRKIIAYRNGSTGKSDFNGKFVIPSLEAPLNVAGYIVTLNFFVDQSSVEVLTENGSLSMTNIVFPSSIYNRLSVEGSYFVAQMRPLKSIWK